MQASRVNCDRDCARLIYLSGLEDRATNKSLERLSVMWYTWVEFQLVVQYQKCGSLLVDYSG